MKKKNQLATVQQELQSLKDGVLKNFSSSDLFEELENRSVFAADSWQDYVEILEGEKEGMKWGMIKSKSFAGLNKEQKAIRSIIKTHEKFLQALGKLKFDHTKLNFD